MVEGLLIKDLGKLSLNCICTYNKMNKLQNKI